MKKKKTTGNLKWKVENEQRNVQDDKTVKFLAT